MHVASAVAVALLAVGALPAALSCAKYAETDHFKHYIKKYVYADYIKRNHPACYRQYVDYGSGVTWLGSVVNQMQRHLHDKPAAIQWWCAKYCHEECSSWQRRQILLADEGVYPKARFDDIAFGCQCVGYGSGCKTHVSLRQVVRDFRTECMGQTNPAHMPENFIGFEYDATTAKAVAAVAQGHLSDVDSDDIYNAFDGHRTIMRQLAQLYKNTCCCAAGGGGEWSGPVNTGMGQASCAVDALALGADANATVSALVVDHTDSVLDHDPAGDTVTDRLTWSLRSIKASVVATVLMLEQYDADSGQLAYARYGVFAPTVRSVDVSLRRDERDHTRIVLLVIPDKIVYTGNEINIRAAMKVPGRTTKYDIMWTPLKLGYGAKVTLNTIMQPNNHEMYVHKRDKSCVYAGTEYDDNNPLPPITPLANGDMLMTVPFPDDERLYGAIPRFSIVAAHEYYDNGACQCAVGEQCLVDFAAVDEGVAPARFECVEWTEPPPPPPPTIGVDAHAEVTVDVEEGEEELEEGQEYEPVGDYYGDTNTVDGDL